MGIPDHVSEEIAEHLDAIREHFKAPKVTLVVRAPSVADGDLVMTDDDPTAAIFAIRRLISRTQTPPKNELEGAVRLADRVLDRPNADPDDDLAVLARQLLRANEALQRIAISHIPDQPAGAPGDELYWAQRHVGTLRGIADRASIHIDRPESED